MHARHDSFRFWCAASASVKPVIAVSACLLGDQVRYDGTHKLQVFVSQLSSTATLSGFCPELSADLGVPRPPVQLVKIAGRYRAFGCDDKALEVSEALHTAAEKQIGELQRTQAVAIIFKSRSPSCGLGSTPEFNVHGQQQGLASGIAAYQICTQLPQLIAIEEITLLEPAKCKVLLIACQIAEEFRQLGVVDLSAWISHYQKQFNWQPNTTLPDDKPMLWLTFKNRVLQPWIAAGAA